MLVNTILRCTIYHGMPDWWENILFRAEISFLVIFSLETGVKLYGLGFLLFFRSAFNTFDLVVVITSIIDFALSVAFPGFSLGISILRNGSEIDYNFSAVVITEFLNQSKSSTAIKNFQSNKLCKRSQ